VSVDFCKLNDRLPRRCDFLHDNLQTLTPCHVVILVFVAAILSMEVYDDLKEAIDEKAEFELVSRKIIGTRRHGLLRAYLWWSHQMRLYVIPPQVMGAAAALILNETMNVQNIVLNGAGIGFILRVDDMLGAMLPYFVRYNAEQSQVEKPEHAVDSWDQTCISVQTLLLCMLLLVMVLAPEWIMVLVGDEEKASGYGFPCSDIVNVCRDFPWLVGALFAYAVVTCNLVTKRSACWRGIVELTLITLLGSFHYRFMKFVWTPYLYLQPYSAAFRTP